MKCVLDATVDFRRLLQSDDNHKLLTSIYDKSMVEHQISALKQAGVRSLFVLVLQDTDVKHIIARVASRYGLNPTFLEVDPEVAKQKRSLLLAQAYMKEAFIYLPVNRLVSTQLLKGLSRFPVSSHQMVSLVYSGTEHPQTQMNSLSRLHYSRGRIVAKRTSDDCKSGTDIGVYKCTPIIFKLIERMPKNRPLNWHQMMLVMSRADRALVFPTKQNQWGVIETAIDVDMISQLKCEQQVNKLPLSRLDHEVLSPLFHKAMAEMVKHKVEAPLLLNSVMSAMLLGLAMMMIGQWVVGVIGAVIAAVAFLCLPLLKLLPGDIEFKWPERSHAPLLILTLQVSANVMLASSMGLVLWHLVGLLMIAASAYWVYESLHAADDLPEGLAGSNKLALASAILVTAIVPAALALLIVGGFAVAHIALRFKHQGSLLLPS
ncbi:hypothetical protein [Pleionea sp. CnH1-48]|uniref:hypothetical protein n=1 Tax=Pleionea sp. CnH1-48 TaxID=2954494 RepID=UPI00209752E6|nr:hypothetical protein [Pleionea sp. CnH1-48]MCO7223693.1 hypothetical protein [Pleionea sp. CnH1-48]